ncbi:MAG: hypothetical protein IPL24_05660 [Bacteroidetes bacterium]|nr:hypothetical protein [Bacteroidota bacterium]
MNRCWSIDQSANQIFSTADFTLNWDATDVDLDAITSNFGVGSYYSDASIWSIATSSNPQPTSIDVSGVTTFADRFYQVGEVASYAVNDYRTVSDGAWDDISNWETFDGNSWVPAIDYPVASNAEQITITDHYMVPGNTSPLVVDQLIINPGSSLLVTEMEFTIADGAGIDLQCSGTIEFSAATFNILGNAQFEDGSTFLLGSDIYGPGIIDFLPGSTIEMSSGSYSFNDGLTINNYTPITWNSNATITFGGANTFFNNYDNLYFNASTSFLGSISSNSQFNNMPSGTIWIDTGIDGLIYDEEMQFNNLGVVELQSASELRLGNSFGTHSGTYRIYSDAELNGLAELNFTEVH